MDKFFRDLIQLADDEAVEVFNPVEKLEDLNKVRRISIYLETIHWVLYFLIYIFFSGGQETHS